MPAGLPTAPSLLPPPSRDFSDSEGRQTQKAGWSDRKVSRNSPTPSALCAAEGCNARSSVRTRSLWLQNWSRFVGCWRISPPPRTGWMSGQAGAGLQQCQGPRTKSTSSAKQPALADVPGVAARSCRPDFYSWKECREQVLAVSPCHNLPHLHLQTEIPQLFCLGGVQLILFVGQPLECKKQMKEGGEERGSASKLCSAPELAVLNLSDFPSKPPLCGE